MSFMLNSLADCTRRPMSNNCTRIRQAKRGQALCVGGEGEGWGGGGEEGGGEGVGCLEH